MSTDSHHISDWDRVDALARALLDSCGLSLTNTEGREIKHLYDELIDYDKKPLSFESRPKRPLVEPSNNDLAILELQP